MAELEYNSLVNRPTSQRPFEIMIGLLPSKAIDLVSLSTEAKLYVEPDAFSKHIYDMLATSQMLAYHQLHNYN